MNTRFKKRFQTKLLEWYAVEKRNLPWRRTKDPYRIWVAEIMLQQTQVATALSYYNRFVRRFPSVRSLARASLDDVLKAWEGLGYYGRARNFHRAACMVVSRSGGKVPDTWEAFSSLPGVGRYTAGAVLSIAFGRRVPILDGNIIRLFSRLFRITENTDLNATRDGLWDMAASLLPEKNLRDFNEALMELGATVCQPRSPLCARCPLAGLCEAKRLSLQNELPVRTPRKPVPHFDVTAGVIRKGGRFLITKRPPKGLLGGLWEFPGGKVEKGETLEACLKREIREELKISIRVGRPLVSVRHAYTHFKITLHVFECRFIRGKIRLIGCDDAAWVTAADLGRYAFPGADRKVIEQIKETMP